MILFACNRARETQLVLIGRTTRSDLAWVPKCEVRQMSKRFV